MESGKVHVEIVPVESEDKNERQQKEQPEPKDDDAGKKGSSRPGVVRSVCQVLLRSLAFSFMLAAALVMRFNQQTADIAGFSVHASYLSSPAFRFFFYGSAVVSGYCAASVALFFCSPRSGFLHFLDMMAMSLAMAAASAATAVGYIGKRGNSETGWTEVCSYYSIFCKLTTVAIGSSYIGFLFLLLVCAFFSSNKAKKAKKKSRTVEW